ncbi:MAG: ABC transporter ATP-binding protein [Saprospiraceae bacterium]|nr:ABC transporter ATP-binding protein [Saprospiraceae bacterium]HMW38212.1 ABC transporter ATP-binding protein [Saprospiraceae bacterium]HMX87407.1 ABC transporter ATP-binding protein [Saprospiraceae bacterium]HMZ39234.1 ABC transporter ATP-binding protein [Saprospiraceae bacterium]HNA63467.1 ABC transporter ATP-binding protein [Saprospiraceae bacterium]
MFAITCKGISKSYVNKKQTTKALRDINLEVNSSELFGLIGPDGAGKTSLMRILATLILADIGIATVDGSDVVRDFELIRKKIGYMPGRFSLYQDLSVAENLEFYASVFNTTVNENYELIRDIYVQIEPFKNRRAGALSGGMKQKLALSCALIHRPKVLFLDEPTTGVDAVSRIEFWEMLKRLQAKGMTIFVSTPYMDEASLCDRIALIQNGRLLAVESPANIRSEFAGQLWSVRSKNMSRLMKDLKEWAIASSAFSFGDSIHLSIKGQRISASDINNYLSVFGHQQIEAQQIEASVEDCFMQLMSNE